MAASCRPVAFQSGDHLKTEGIITPKTQQRDTKDTQPYLNHETLTQCEQAKHLGVKEESTFNLGHRVPISRIMEHPLRGQPTSYDSTDTARTFRDPARGQGVYTGRNYPQSGISSEQNLRGWGDYAKSNSFHGKDPKGRGAGSDGHLESTRNWPGFEYGSESGLGTIEKQHKR